MPASGGDSVTVVEETGRRLWGHPDARSISEQMVLLDSGRIDADRAAGRDARVLAKERGLEVVLMAPILEGLLVRLHEGRETHAVAPRDAERQLRAPWPGSHKR